MTERGRIRDQLRGKTILLTGGTGFLGKVIVERLLRCAPDVAGIYLLIRPPRDAPSPQAAVARFDTDVLTSGVFETLARTHNCHWPAFARSRITPVAGDVSQPRLALADRDYATLTSSVDIIINAAASVVFDAPLNEALLHNTRGVQHVAEFARACTSTVLVHVSTAFVSGRRTGLIAETPYDADASATLIRDAEDAIAAIEQDAASQQRDARTTRALLIEEGMTQARRLGWHDSYTYTKALGETELARHRGDVPSAVVRPSIIESSLREPEPGWLENLNVADPLLVEYGRGRMPDFPLPHDRIVDIVPVDLVANAIVALLPHVAGTSDISYYAIGSGAINPVSGGQIHEYAYEYFRRNPMLDRQGRPILPERLTFPTAERFRKMFPGAAGRNTTTKRLMYLADLYETYLNVDCVFDTTNTQRLLDGLDDADRGPLDFDVRRIDWRSYIQDVHIPGLRRHVLGEDVDHVGVSGRG